MTSAAQVRDPAWPWVAYFVNSEALARFTANGWTERDVREFLRSRTHAPSRPLNPQTGPPSVRAQWTRVGDVLSHLTPAQADEYVDAFGAPLDTWAFDVISAGAPARWCALATDLSLRGWGSGRQASARMRLTGSGLLAVWHQMTATPVPQSEESPMRWLWAAVVLDERWYQTFGGAVDWQRYFPSMVGRWAGIPHATSWIVTGHTVDTAHTALAECDSSASRAILSQKVLTIEALHPDPMRLTPRRIPLAEPRRSDLKATGGDDDGE